MSNEQPPPPASPPTGESPPARSTPKARVAWQPLTARGVAAFAGASAGRLWLVQFVVALLASAVVVWFLKTCWFPPIREAIAALPPQGEVVFGRLTWAADSPRRLSEGPFLAFTVDLEHGGQARSPAHIYVEFGRSDVRIFSLLGHYPAAYPSLGRVPFNRNALIPWWGAWSPVFLWVAGALTAAGLMVAWSLVAGFYAVPAWLIAFYRNRELGILPAWRMAGASLMPGALFLTALILLYGAGVLDLVRLAFGMAAHFVVGWVYIWMSAGRLPPLAGSEPKGNPFDKENNGGGKGPPS